MDFKQLEAFINVVKYSSFSKTAEIMNVSQPSVSSYINGLEKELGTTLLLRSTKDVSITKEGRILHEYAVNILNLKNNAVYEIKKVNQSPEGEINLFASSVPAQYILPKILPRFNNFYPNVKYKVHQSQSYNIISDICSKEVVWGIVGSVTDDAQCEFEHFLDDRLVIIMPYNMKYLNLDIEHIENFLTSEKIILREENSGTHREIMRRFNEMGISFKNLNTIAVLNNTQSVIESVAAGLGFAIVSELAAKYYIEQNLIFSPKKDFLDIKRAFYFVYGKNSELPFIERSFAEFAKEFYKDK